MISHEGPPLYHNEFPSHRLPKQCMRSGNATNRLAAEVFWRIITHSQLSWPAKAGQLGCASRFFRIMGSGALWNLVASTGWPALAGHDNGCWAG